MTLACYETNFVTVDQRQRQKIESREKMADKKTTTMTAIPNLLSRTAMGKEYLAVSLAQKGLSLLFSRDATCKKLTAKEVSINPIGFHLAHHRALKAESEQEASLDYAAQHEPVEKW